MAGVTSDVVLVGLAGRRFEMVKGALPLFLDEFAPGYCGRLLLIKRIYAYQGIYRPSPKDQGDERTQQRGWTSSLSSLGWN
jgi:hypothetical protein